MSLFGKKEPKLKVPKNKDKLKTPKKGKGKEVNKDENISVNRPKPKPTPMGINKKLGSKEVAKAEIKTPPAKVPLFGKNRNKVNVTEQDLEQELEQDQSQPVQHQAHKLEELVSEESAQQSTKAVQPPIPVTEEPKVKSNPKPIPTTRPQRTSPPKSFNSPKVEEPIKPKREIKGLSKKASAPISPKQTAPKKKAKKVTGLFSKHTVSEAMIQGLRTSDIIVPNALAYSATYLENKGYPKLKEVVDISALTESQPVTQLLAKPADSAPTVSIESSLNIIDTGDVLTTPVQSMPVEPTPLVLNENEDTDLEFTPVTPQAEPVVESNMEDTLILDEEESNDIEEEELTFLEEETKPVREGGLDEVTLTEEDLQFELEEPQEVEEVQELELQLSSEEQEELAEQPNVEQQDELELQLESENGPFLPEGLAIASGLQIASDLAIPSDLNIADDLQLNLDSESSYVEGQQADVNLEEPNEQDGDEIILDEDELELTQDALTEKEGLNLEPVEEPVVSDSLNFEPIQADTPQDATAEKLVLGGAQSEEAEKLNSIVNSATFDLGAFKTRLLNVKEDEDLTSEIADRESEISKIKEVADREKQIKSTASLVDALRLAQGGNV